MKKHKSKPIFQPKKITDDSLKLARAGVGLAFGALTLGVAANAFKNAWK